MCHSHVQYNLFYCQHFCVQIDRLQTDIQERDLSCSQQETLYRSDIADREEEISRLKADLNVMHEKLAQSEGQVSAEF